MPAINSKRLICILGPTAVGKTKAAIELAKHFRTEIISADSRQFYREISIGTAKPNEEELGQIRHHFIGCKSVEESYSAGDFERDAIQTINQLFLFHDTIVLVGGSGLYVKAVYEGLHVLPKADEVLRTQLQDLFLKEGIEPLQIQLQKLDMERWLSIDQQNPQRLMRAIEIALNQQGGFHDLIQAKKEERNFQILKVAIDLPREQLYEKINLRVAQMIQNGLVEEAKKMIPFRNQYALQTVGYAEIFDYFDGKISLEKAIELIQQHSRNYAKKQLTWLRREQDIIWTSPDEVLGLFS